MSGPIVILTLKVLVVAVTLLFLCSLVALAQGKYRLHGQINTAFFILTMVAVFGLELVVRVLFRNLSDEFFSETGPVRQPLLIHLWFSVPSALILPFMLYTGKSGRGTIHRALAAVFCVLWIGTFITGVFFLPHSY